MIGAEPSIRSTQRVDVGGSRGRRQAMFLGLAVAVLLLAGVVLGRSDDGADTPVAEETTTTTPPTTTTTSRGTTTLATTTTTAATGPVLPVPTGASLLVFGDGRWTVVDLDTGARRPAPRLGGQYYEAAAVPAGLVVHLDGRREAVLYALDALGDDAPAPAVLGLADQVLLSGRPDAVWLVDNGGPLVGDRPATTTTVRLVDLHGSVLRTIDVDSAFIGGVSERGAIVAQGGRIFVVDEEGAHSLAVGDLLRVEDDHALVRECDERQRCQIELLDLMAGSSAPLDVPGSLVTYGAELAVAPDGRVAVMTYPSDASSGHLWLFDANARPAGDIELSTESWSPVWLPGDLGVLLVGGGLGLDRVTSGDDGLVREPLPGLQDLRAELVYLISPVS